LSRAEFEEELAMPSRRANRESPDPTSAKTGQMWGARLRPSTPQAITAVGTRGLKPGLFWAVLRQG
jgi:hypothetical protein